MDAPSSHRALHSPQPPDVNLYCLQCEAQIGIFANEWLRLTSSYARSKEKGTHFGTEVGQRTQVVPQGPAPNAAAGCEMAEVFCRRCSNMVGQFCKRAPPTAKQDIIDQYFYKLSRTFLKDSKSNLRVEPVYGFSDGFTRSVSGRSTSSIPRISMTPTSRWTHTPLREASSTPSVQTATRSVLRNSSMPSLQIQPAQEITPYKVNEITGPSQQQIDRLDQELVAQNVMLREHSSRIASQAVQAANHEGRMRDHDARLQNQEMRTRLHLSQIQQQEATITEQQNMIETQEVQLRQVSQQLQSLHNSMAELRTLIDANRLTTFTQPTSPIAENNFIENLEMILKTVREAKSNDREVQSLRSRNEELQSRLDTILSAADNRSASRPESRSSGGETSFDAAQATHVLGKRKRERSSIGHSALRSEEPPTSVTKRSVRFEEQQVGHDSVPQPIPADQNLLHQTSATPSNSTDLIQTAMSVATNNSTSKDMSFATNTQLEHQIVEVEKEFDASREIPKLPEAVADNTIETLEQPTTVTVTQVQDIMQSPNDQASDSVGFTGNSVIDSPADNLHQPDVPDTQLAGEDNLPAIDEPAVPPYSNFVQDTSMFDAVEFSDDDDDLAFGHGGPHDSDMTGEDNDDGDDGLQVSNKQSRRVTDSWVGRDQRSLAPEPPKRRRTTTSAVVKPVNMDRIHIGTPALFTAAILKGREPKMSKPPAINTRQKDLHDELTRLGLAEWIGKDKKNKEYRDAVTAARARYRNHKKAALLNANGLRHDHMDTGTGLPEQPLTEPPSVAARKLILTQIYNPSVSVGPQFETSAGDENTPSFQSAGDKTVAQGTQDDHTEIEPDQRITRARARRSSASVVEHIETPSSRSGVVLTDTEPPSKKRKSDTAKKPPRPRKSLTTPMADANSPNADGGNDIGNDDASHQLYDNSQNDVDLIVVQPTRGRGRPKKAHGPILTPDPTIGSPQIDNPSTNNLAQNHAHVHTQPSPVSLTNSPLQHDRQQLLAKMKARAEERDNAIAMRDQLAKETMEREMAMGL